jgi:O-antigen/teichoic acid export membrane protein
VNTLHSAARNVSIVAASQVIIWPATLIFTIVQARFLGPARFGELTLALSYAAVLSTIIDFGLGTQLSRMVAQRAGHQQALFGTMAIRAVLWLIAIPVVWLVTLVLGYDNELRNAILILAVSVLLMMGVGNTFSTYLQGREEFVLPTVAVIAQRLTVAGTGVLALVLRPDLAVVAAAFVVAAVVQIVVLAAGMRRAGWVRPRLAAGTSFQVLRGAIPLGLYWVVAAFYFNVDMAMLQQLAPPENVGWYAAAYRLFNIGAILPTIVVGTVLYPVFARLSLGARSELRLVVEKTLTFLTITGVAAALVLMLFAEPIVALLYPLENYAGAPNALRLLGPGLLFQYLNWVIAYVLLGLHREKRMLAIALAAAVLNPIANLVAIPLLRQDGAALITSLTELGLLVCLTLSTPRDLLSFENIRVAAKATVSAIAAAVAVWALHGLPVVVTLPLALAVFAAVALLLHIVAPADLRALRSLTRAAPAANANPAIASFPTEEVA